VATLGKTTPYGEVHGASDGTRYVQGDKSFDGNGDEIGATKPVKAVKAPKAKPVEDVDAQLAEQLKDLT